jgi:hypothetical protein
VDGKMIFENAYIDRKIRKEVGIIIIGFLLMVAVTDAMPWEKKDFEKNTDFFYLKNGFAIRIISIDNEILPPKLWIALEKEGIKYDDEILNSGEEYSYSKDLDEIKLKIEVFSDKQKSIVFLKDLYQSSNGEVLINYESSNLYPGSISSYQSTNDLIYSNSPVPGGINIQQATSIGYSTIRQITVDDDEYADYTTIQQAIDSANNGDTIYVKNGTYFEHLLIVKNNLTIIGENKDSTIIDGGREGEVVVLMGANNNTIKEITVQNAKPDETNFPPVFGNSRVFLKENYSLVLNAIDAKAYPRQAWITLWKNNTKLDDKVIAEGQTYDYRYDYSNQPIVLSLKADYIFSGSSSDYIKLSNITQYSELNLNVIVSNEKALLKVGERDDFIPSDGGIEWNIQEGYSIKVLDIDVKTFPRKAMLLLSKNDLPVDFRVMNVT